MVVRVWLHGGVLRCSGRLGHGAPCVFRSSEGVWLLVITLALTSSPVWARQIPQAAESANGHDNNGVYRQLSELTQSVGQLTQRLATLEISLEGRLQRLSERSTQEEHTLNTLLSRVSSLPPLGARLDLLEERFVRESAVLYSSLRGTNKDVQSLVTQLERFEVVDSMGSAGGVNLLGSSGGSNHEGSSGISNIVSSADKNNKSSGGLPDGSFDTSGGEHLRRTRHEHQAASKAGVEQLYESLSHQVSRRLGQVLEQNLPRLLQVHRSTLLEDLKPLMEQMTQATSAELGIQHKILGQQVKDQAEGLLGNLTQHRKQHGDCNCRRKQEGGARQPTSALTKTLLTKTSTTSGNRTDIPASHQPSHNMGGSWSGNSAGVGMTPRQAPCPPDASTVAALSEVQVLLRSVLAASDDLHRSVSRQTSEGLELLQLLHQRFSVLLRRINSEPDTGEALISEVQELENLVESSYSSILHAQNVFIASCHRIQGEEPLVEAKITDILDKIVTSIELGHQYNREQLGELRQLVRQMGHPNTTAAAEMSIRLTHPSPPAVIPSTSRSPSSPLPSSGSSEHVMTRIWTNALVRVNITSERLGDVAARVAQVQNRLISTNWGPLAEQKQHADQLLTAAKDLYGYARNQLQILSDLRNSLESIREGRPFTHESDRGRSIYLRDANYPETNQVVLPPACTVAFLPLIRLHQAIDNESGRSNEQSKPDTKKEVQEFDSAPNPQKSDIGAGTPGWEAGPDILMTPNVGASQNRFPEFKEEDWVDQYEDYHHDYRVEEASDLGEDHVADSASHSDAVNNDHIGDVENVVVGNTTKVADVLSSGLLGLGQSRLQIP